MKRTIRYYRIIWLRHDLMAGISVFLVALPLCMGIALASGAPLYAGILSGIIGGIVVPLISKSALAVSGPGAGLSTVVAAGIATLHDYRLFLLTVVVAGFFQVLMGAIKLGKISNYFPSSVIKGMLAAIGIILISNQMSVALGFDKPGSWTSSFLDIFKTQNILGNLDNLLHHLNSGAIIISALSLAIMLLLQRAAFNRLKMIPAPLFVVLAGIAINLIYTHISNINFKPVELVNLPAHVFASITFPDITQLFTRSDLWINGIIIGTLASLETLLCIEAIDKLDRRNRLTPVNRELIAQGVGNMVCGFLGAIPITAVIVRGAANVDAGARTKLSAFTHGVLLLLAVISIPFALNLIPRASLAAILLVTGYNLTRPKLYISVWKQGLKQFIPFIATIIIILSTDLLKGVSIGLLVSIYYIIQNNFKAEYKINKVIQHQTEVYVIKLNTNVTFLNKVKIREALDQIPVYSILTIDASECNFIDYDILEIISEFEAKAHDRHIEVHLKGITKVDVTSVH